MSHLQHRKKVSNASSKSNSISALEKLLIHSPNDAQALHDLGIAYSIRLEHGRALGFLFQAVAADHTNANFNSSLGLCLLHQGKNLEAICAFRQAISVDVNFAEAYDGLGLALKRSGHNALAIGCFRKAVEIKPRVTKYFVNLSFALANQHEYAEAYAVAIRSHLIDPNSLDSCCCVVESCLGQGRFRLAKQRLLKFLHHNPKWSDGYHNLARILQCQGYISKAIVNYNKAIELHPKGIDAHFGLATCLLGKGNYTKGWEEYEWRFKLEGWQRSIAAGFVRDLTEPMWAGEDLNGKTILIYGEQGFGDTIQMARYAVILAKRNCRVILMVYSDTAALLRSVPSIFLVIAYGDLIPRYDYHIPLFSLPKALRTTVETIPCPIPYVFPPKDRKTPQTIALAKTFRGNGSPISVSGQ